MTNENVKADSQPEPDWEAFGREIMACWLHGDVDACWLHGDVDGGFLQELAEKHNIITPVPGGYDPKVHGYEFVDMCEPGDAWYKRNYPIHERTTP